MKIRYYFLFSFLLIFFCCDDENLPEAHLNIPEVGTFTADPGNQEVSLFWSAAGNSSPDGYYIEWERNGVLIGNGDTIVDKTENSIVIKELLNHELYNLSIQAIYGNQRSGKKSISSTPGSAWFIPTNVIAVIGDSEIELRWNRPESDKLTGYRIEVTPDDRILPVNDASVESYTITGLENNVTYEIGIRSIYTDGESALVTLLATPGGVQPILTTRTHYLVNETFELEINSRFFTQEIKSVRWDFGDGRTSTEENPSHQYSHYGKYEVKLFVTYEDDEEDSFTKELVAIGFSWELDLNLPGSSRGQVKASTPVFGDDGTIYISLSGSGTIGDLYAIHPQGSIKWNYSGPTAITYGGGPTIGNEGTIYTGAEDKNLYAVQPDGSQKWIYTCTEKVVSFPAVGTDGTIYVMDNANVLHAIDPSGSSKWTVQLVGGTTAGAVGIGADGTIYAGTYNYIYAFDASGNEKWKTEAAVTEKVTFAFHNGTLYAPQRAGSGIMAVNMETGSVKWRYPIGGNSNNDAYSPVVSKDGAIYFTTKSDGIFHAVKEDGSKKWEFTTNRPMIYVTPVLDENGIIYFGTQDATNYPNGIFAINTEDGSLAWDMILEAGNPDKIMAGACISSDGILYMGTIGDNTKNGRLLAIPIFAGPETATWSMRGGNQYGNNREE